MNRKTIDIAIVILLVVAIAISSFSVYLHFTDSSEHNADVKGMMDSVMELTCWDDDSNKVSGTGFIIENNGNRLMTNAHMVIREKNSEIGPYANIIAKFANKERTYSLIIERYDSEKDVALLKFTEDVSFKALKLNTERPAYGEKVTVIGNAMGYGLSVKESVVSVPEINITCNGVTKNTVMISLTINHGDSGSPIINDKGEVIGMSSFKLKDDGKTVEGMSYGITAKSMNEFISAES